MWGRSIIYRFAASTAFGAHFLMEETAIDPGFARRITSYNVCYTKLLRSYFANHKAH